MVGRPVRQGLVSLADRDSSLMFPRLIAFALAGAVSACGGGLPEPNAVDAERAGAPWPSVKVADLAQGRDLYQGRCASCH